MKIQKQELDTGISKSFQAIIHMKVLWIPPKNGNKEFL